MRPMHFRKSLFSRTFNLIFVMLLFLVPWMASCTGADIFSGSADDQGTEESLGVHEAEQAHAADEADEAEEEGIILFISAGIGLLLIASLVGIATSRLRLPYTVGLVLIGLALSLRGQEPIDISPQIFLGLLVPPLIFEAAFHLKAKDLLKDLGSILALAIPGVLITTFLVGGVVAWGTGFPLSIALVFGALVAATDPVAVVALFRTLGVPKRLTVLLEGESLFNDGTAIVVFNLMIVIAVSGQFDLVSSILDFVVVSGGGLVIGFILGALISRMIAFIDDALIETTLTTVLAFGSYIVAEQFHVSGVLAVVAAGLVSGNIGPRGMSPSSRILLFNFWDYAAFLANSVVFLLIGLQINLRVLVADWQVIAWAIGAVLVARAVGVYGLLSLRKGISLPYKNVLYWGGLRGAISLALALSLPATLGTARDEIQTMAFGVVLFTLLVQGLTMKPLINKMDLIQRSEAQEEYQRRHARAVMAKASHERLENMFQEGFISAHLWGRLSKPIKQHAEALADAVEESLRADPELEFQELNSAFRDLLQSQRSALSRLQRDGIIAEEIYSQLLGEVDSALSEPRSNLAELVANRTNLSINGIMTVIVQETDVENVIAALNRLGIPVTRLSSSGGFLGRRNVTLLIGTPEEQEEKIIEAITNASRQRVALLTETGLAPSDAKEVMIGGATIFTLDVERYEEL
jgi:monovalent cation:H+ antiporter, CPA1 family